MNLLPIIIVVLLAIIGIVVYFSLRSKYNILVTIREETKHINLIKFDTAREIVGQDNVKKLKLWRGKAVITLPPDYCYELDARGKKYIEFVKRADLTYVPIKLVNIPRADGTTIAEMQTDEHEARVAVYSEWIKGAEMQKNGIMQMLKDFVPVLGLIIIIVFAYLMFQNFNETSVKLANANLGITEQQVKMQEQINTYIAAATTDKPIVKGEPPR